MVPEEVMSQEDIQWVRNTLEVADLMFEKMKTLPSDVHELLLNILKNAARMGNKESPRIVRDVEMWLHGYYKLTPRDWASTQIRLAQMKDPQYELYQKLKRKFEGPPRKRKQGDQDIPPARTGHVCTECLKKAGFEPHDLGTHGTCSICQRNFKSDDIHDHIHEIGPILAKLDMKPCGVYGCTTPIPKHHPCCSECSDIQ
jgi:hypothetical protein